MNRLYTLLLVLVVSLVFSIMLNVLQFNDMSNTLDLMDSMASELYESNGGY